MNESTITSNSKDSYSLLTSATEDEIIVSQILLDLKNLMSLSESLANFNWGCKRRRSCLDAPAPSLSAPSWPSPQVQNEIEERRTYIKDEKVAAEEKHGGATRTTFSPDTPLSFSPSNDESDDKSKHSFKKTSKKRSKEEYLNMIEGLTQRKDLLRGEIENVKKHYNKLKAYNSELKAIKQEVLNSSVRKEISGDVNLGMELTQHYRVHIVPHQRPFTAVPTAQEFQYSSDPVTAQSQPSNDGLGSVNHVGPLGIDLNIPAEEAFAAELSQPLDVSRMVDDKRARFAEARRKRKVIIKTKYSRVGL